MKKILILATALLTMFSGQNAIAQGDSDLEYILDTIGTDVELSSGAIIDLNKEYSSSIKHIILRSDSLPDEDTSEEDTIVDTSVIATDIDALTASHDAMLSEWDNALHLDVDILEIESMMEQ